ncbi:hypothetical protein MA20_25885 [Bradyrhizobium japonicum]|uniref:Uncharacterized protein n=1 Tax=Bradyrhizobium japonicum TaxID=375 RepID=A0A0A3XSH3_BRAJP|nr:hypothetical protein [Bradyrhizobium japonicum]KGT76244.1 hypothetical protein MA20_25885 [Bradyrhizobium japonicum]
MTDSEWKERWHEVERFRLMAHETTDPVAAALLLDIVSDLEADLNELVDVEAQGLPPSRARFIMRIGIHA